MDSVDWKLLRPVQTKSEAGFVVPPSSLPWGFWQCVIVFLHKHGVCQCIFHAELYFEGTPSGPSMILSTCEQEASHVPAAARTIEPVLDLFLWALFELPDRSHDLSPLAAVFMQPHRMSGHAVQSLLNSGLRTLCTLLQIRSCSHGLC